MKNKLRNIKVNNKEFVYWFLSTEKFVLTVSPREEKNTKIIITFDAKDTEFRQMIGWGLFGISAVKNGEVVCLKIAEPKFVSTVVEYFINTGGFTKNKIHNFDGFKLLEDMKYSEIKPIWSFIW